eukprot:12919216-Prorocentrum_lima.AAC.1
MKGSRVGWHPRAHPRLEVPRVTDAQMAANAKRNIGNAGSPHPGVWPTGRVASPLETPSQQ